MFGSFEVGEISFLALRTKMDNYISRPPFPRSCSRTFELSYSSKALLDSYINTRLQIILQLNIDFSISFIFPRELKPDIVIENKNINYIIHITVAFDCQENMSNVNSMK